MKTKTVLISLIITIFTIVICSFTFVNYSPIFFEVKQGSMIFLNYSPKFDSAEMYKQYDVFDSNGIYVQTIEIDYLAFHNYDHQLQKWINTEPIEGNITYWTNPFGFVMRVENR